MKLINNILFTACIFLVTGCSTMKGSHTPQLIHVTVNKNGQCTVQNKIVSISKIEKAVKATGADKNTRIAITVPRTMNYIDTKKIINNLAAKGYIKIYFQKPRESISYVNKK